MHVYLLERILSAETHELARHRVVRNVLVRILQESECQVGDQYEAGSRAVGHEFWTSEAGFPACSSERTKMSPIGD